MSHKYNEKTFKAFQDKITALAETSGLTDPQLQTFKTALTAAFEEFNSNCKAPQA